jgi:hypothetical protein
MINNTIFTKRLWVVFSLPVPQKRESDDACYVQTDLTKNDRWVKRQLTLMDE